MLNNHVDIFLCYEKADSHPPPKKYIEWAKKNRSHFGPLLGHPVYDSHFLTVYLRLLLELLNGTLLLKFYQLVFKRQ